MKISNYKRSDDYTAEFQCSNEERQRLVDYGRKNIDYEKIEDFLLNWALVDLLRKGIKKYQSDYFRNELAKDEIKRLKALEKKNGKRKVKNSDASRRVRN